MVAGGGRGEVHPWYHGSAQWSPFWVPGSQLLSGDYVQKHSSSRESGVSWRIKDRLKAGGVIWEGDKESESVAMVGDRGGRSWARRRLLVVAAWMGESPVWVPEAVQWWGNPPWVGHDPACLRDWQHCFPTRGRWMEPDGALPPPASEVISLLTISSPL